MATEHQAKELRMSSRKSEIGLTLRHQRVLTVGLIVRLNKPGSKFLEPVRGNRFKKRRLVLEVPVGCHGGHACITSNRSKADLLAPLQ